MKTATLTQLLHIIKHESLDDQYKAAKEMQERKRIRMALIGRRGQSSFSSFSNSSIPSLIISFNALDREGILFSYW